MSAQEFLDLPLVKVIDGDTLEARVDCLPAPLNRVLIRLKGIDAPEIDARARCDREREWGLQAQLYLTMLLRSHATLRLSEFTWDKYGGRIVATVHAGDTNLNAAMLATELARSAERHQFRRSWCE